MPQSRGQKLTLKLWLKSFTKLETILSVVLSVIVLLILFITILWILKIQYCDDDEDDVSRNKDTIGKSAALSLHMVHLMPLIMDRNNRTICLANLVSPKWSLTVASCVQSSTSDSLYTQVNKRVAIEMIIVHPFHNITGDDYDLAMIKTIEDLQSSNACAYLASPRMEAMMTRYDMLTTRFDIRCVLQLVKYRCLFSSTFQGRADDRPASKTG